MMMPSDGQEMLLRRENFGGTLFHPKNATFVQLDHEGFDCAKRILGQGEKPRNHDEEIFIREIFQEIPDQNLPVRVVEFKVPNAPPGIQLLSAPTLVDFQITERCGLGCPQCYASSVTKGQDLSWEDAEIAVRQMREAGVCQVALGGGEPVLYPHLAKLIKLIRDHGMVPNMTTTGIGMTLDQIKSIKENCGAIAMSLEGVDGRFLIRRKQGFENFKKTVQRFLDFEIPLVLQVTVSRGNLEDLNAIAEYCLTVQPLYGVVFLAHKPAGRAEVYDQTLSALDHPKVHEAVLSAVKRLHPYTRVGFDCCFTPAMVGFESDLGFKYGTIVEGCSATRSGLGLTPNLDILPCTFLPGKKLGNLKENSLLEIWNGVKSGGFRAAMKTHSTSNTHCQTCSANSLCMGGCSAWSLTGCVTKAGVSNIKSMESQGPLIC